MTRVPGRMWAYLGAILGGAVSIAANVAHSYVRPEGKLPDWTPEPGAVIGSVFWPVALLVAVEILARVQWPTGRRWVALRYAGLLPVAVVAALVSYRHLSALLTHYGEDKVTAALGPLAVDGLMLMATGALLATGRRGESAADHVDPVVVEPVEVTPDPVPVDPWQYAEPIGPVPAPVEPEPVVDPVPAPVEPVTGPPVEPVKHRVTARSLTAAERVTAAHERHPDATHERIAELARVSVSTVKRYRPARPVTGSPSGPDAAQTMPAKRVNGTPVDLVDIPMF